MGSVIVRAMHLPPDMYYEVVCMAGINPDWLLSSDEISYEGFPQGEVTLYANEIPYHFNNRHAYLRIHKMMLQQHGINPQGFVFVGRSLDSLGIENGVHVQLQQQSNSQECSSTPMGRNDLCPCGSGKKYKKCCMKTEIR